MYKYYCYYLQQMILCTSWGQERPQGPDALDQVILPFFTRLGLGQERVKGSAFSLVTIGDMYLHLVIVGFNETLWGVNGI